MKDAISEAPTFPVCAPIAPPSQATTTVIPDVRLAAQTDDGQSPSKRPRNDSWLNEIQALYIGQWPSPDDISYHVYTLG